MLFTGDDIVQYARDRASRSKDALVDNWMVARQLNDLLRSTIRKVISEDPERLAEEIIIPTADVTTDPDDVDLTSSDTVEWLHIAAMDWRDSVSATYDDEVVLGPIEARHRLETEYGHLELPVGYLFDRMRKIKKVAGWDNVYDLRVYGVLQPTLWDVQDAQGLSRVQDYPEALFRALQTGFLLRVATHLKPSELELQLWSSENQTAMADLLDDAESFVDANLRIEDIPHSAFEV